MPRYKQMPMPPGQSMLFGTSVEDALPKGSDVQAFKDVMDCLNYSNLVAKCSHTGRPPYDPKRLVMILGYAYCKGARSSRRVEELLKVDVRFMWLSGGYKPDHNTIARFRKDNSEELALLFKDSVRLCCEVGLVYLNAVATDGTKIKSAASKRSVYSEGKLERALAAVNTILQEAEEVDRAEDEIYGDGSCNELPEHLRNAQVRKSELEQTAKRLADSGKAAVVKTDPDARVMMTDEGKRPCYNLQASVDAENQVIVAMELTQSENDCGKLPEMVEEVEDNTSLSPDVCLVDTGYGNETTLKWLDETNHNALMPLQEQPQESARNDLFCSKCFVMDDKQDMLICPAGRKLTFRGLDKTGSGTYRRYCAIGCQSCSFYRQCVPKGRGSRRVNISIVAAQRKRMRERLHSFDGRRLYALRQQTVEPVFGQLKSNHGLDRFLCWGLKGATAEVALACLGHNVAKCAASAIAHAYIAGISAQLLAQMILASVLTGLARIHAVLSQPRCSLSIPRTRSFGTA